MWPWQGSWSEKPTACNPSPSARDDWASRTRTPVKVHRQPREAITSRLTQSPSLRRADVLFFPPVSRAVAPGLPPVRTRCRPSCFRVEVGGSEGWSGGWCQEEAEMEVWKLYAQFLEFWSFLAELQLSASAWPHGCTLMVVFETHHDLRIVCFGLTSSNCYSFRRVGVIMMSKLTPFTFPALTKPFELKWV